MDRITTCLVACLILPLVPALGQAQQKGLEFDKPFKGEIGGKEDFARTYNRGLWGARGYAQVQFVDLSAGQNVTLDVKVEGTNRKVGVALIDPTGKVIGMSDITEDKTQLNIPKTNVKGRYQIFILSSQIGEFELEVGGNPKKEPTVKELEDQIAMLKKQLKALEDKLAAKKAQQQKP